MQKKLLLLCMIVNCVMYASENEAFNIYQQDESQIGIFDESKYMDELIAKYAEVYSKKKFDTKAAKSEALKIMHDKEENDLKTQRNKKDLHQCNGWHVVHPDKHCETGRIRIELDKELTKKSTLNNEIYEKYKDGFGLANNITTKIFLMGLWEDKLATPDININDEEWLGDHGALGWKNFSSPRFFEGQDSTIYADIVYKGKILLTRDQIVEAVTNDEDLKSLITGYDNAKKKLKERIDLLNPEKQDKRPILEVDIKEDQNRQSDLSQ